jgi:ribosomal protein S18 acetylase RimI-like enzyme
VSPAVRRLRAHEADLLRDVRLRALRDAPMAFGSTLAREQGYERETWERWAAASATGERQAIFIAEPAPRMASGVRGDAEPAAGMASGVIDDEEPALAHLYAMWVAPDARGAGAGRALLAAVVAWAIGRGAERLTTSVTAGNAAAAALYTATGFADTGRREPLGHSEAVVAVLERRLDER